MRRDTAGAVRATVTATALLLATACTDSGAPTDPTPVEATTNSGLTISNLRASSGRSYEIAREGLAAGVKRYTDRGYRFQSPVPGSLQGRTFIRTADRDKDANPGDRSFLSFDVNRNVTVYVVHDDQATLPDWLRGGFSDTGLDLYDNHPHGGTLSVYRAWFPAGTVTLGSAAWGGAEPVSMYTVLIESQDGGRDTQAPTAPAGLSATAASSSAIDLSWSASDDDVGVAGYHVYRGGRKVADVSGTSYRDTGLAPATRYTYTVAAFDAAGNVSSPSAGASATTEGEADTQPPTMPTDLSATAVSNRVIELSWSAADDDVGVAGYFVYRDGNHVGDVPGTDFRDSGLDASTEYSYTVAAYDAAGNVSDESAVARATTRAGGDTQAPTVPTDLTATALSSSAVDVNWTASNDDVGVAGYFVYRDGAQVGDVSGTTFRDSGLEASTEYGYTVAAYDAAGNVSDVSARASATTEGGTDTEAPTIPTDLSATTASSSAIDLAWTASEDDVGVAGYYVHRGNARVAEVSGTTFRDTGLEAGTSYLYSVAAYDAAGNVSNPSASATATTDAETDTQPPTTPTDLTARAASSSTVDLGWTASEDDVGVAGYYVYRDGSRVADVSGTVYRDSGLAPSTLYDYTVAAYDAAGNVSDRSATASVATDAEQEPPSGMVTNLRVQSGRVYQVVGDGLGAGRARYTDRGYVFESPVPQELRGLIFIRTANADKGSAPGDPSFIKFDVAEDVTVYVAHDDRAPVPAWLGNGFTDTGMDLHDSDDASGTFSVYGGGFSPGTVTLGSNVETGGTEVSMYTVLVRAEGGSGGGADTEAPTVPTGLSASAASSSAIDLSWSASDDDVGVAGYRVYRGNTAVGEVTGTTFRDTGLEPATSYLYTVAAFDAAGNVSNRSASASATTNAGADTQPPTSPTDLSATAASSSAIDLSWSASSDDVGVAGYRVFRGNTAVGDVTGTTFRDTGLEPATSYTYTVAAFDAAGNVSNRSASASATTNAGADTQPPTSPTDLSATAASSSAIDLSWSASSDDVGVAGYYVYRSDETLAGDVSGTSFRDTGLDPGTTYAYKVAAYDAAGNVSARSTGASATTDTEADTQAPTVPANLSAAAASSSTIDLSWSASSDDVGVAGYYVYRNGSQVAGVSGTSYTDTGLAASTSYAYRVAAYDAAGNVSDRSGAVGATTDGEGFPGSPYPASPVIAGMSLQWGTHVRRAPGSDNFPLTWADDGHQYTSWGDGGGFGGTNSNGRVSLGVARVEGSSTGYTGINVNGGLSPESGNSTLSGKSYGILSLGGTLYMWRSPGSDNNNWDAVHLYRSTDKGATWTDLWRGWTESNGVGIPTFLQFGRDYAGARDGYVYSYFIDIQDGSSLAVQKPGKIVLARVPASQIENRGAYQWFAGMSGGEPTWSSSVAARRPVFQDPDGVGWNLAVIYNPGLGRYLLTTEHGRTMVGNVGVFDAPEPWGPWTTVAYESGWPAGGQVQRSTFYWNFSPKWWSNAGRNFVLVFSGVSQNDSWNTVRGSFTLR